MKIHITLAIIAVLVAPLWGAAVVGAENELLLGSKKSVLQREDQAALRLEDVNVKRPESVAGSCSYAPSNASRMTSTGVGAEIQNHLRKMHNPENVWSSGLFLIRVLKGDDFVFLTESSRCPEELNQWHILYKDKIREFAVLFDFIRSNRVLFSDREYTEARMDVSLMLCCIMGIKELRGGRFSNKIYAPDDSNRKWNEFFVAAKKNLSGKVFSSVQDPVLIAASQKYELGLVPFIPVGPSDSGSSVSPPPIVAQSASVNAGEIVAGAKPLQPDALSLDDQIRDKWFEISGRYLYGTLDRKSQFLEAIGYDPSFLFSVSYGQITANWNSVGPNLQAMLRWLNNYKNDPNVTILCKIYYDSMTSILSWSKEDAKKYWDNLEARAKVGFVKRFAIFAGVNPKEEIWKLEFPEVKKTLEALMQSQ